MYTNLQVYAFRYDIMIIDLKVAPSIIMFSSMGVAPYYPYTLAEFCRNMCFLVQSTELNSIVIIRLYRVWAYWQVPMAAVLLRSLPNMRTYLKPDYCLIYHFRDFAKSYKMSMLHVYIESGASDFFYPRPTKLEGGILDSPCPSVCPSVRLSVDGMVSGA